MAGWMGRVARGLPPYLILSLLAYLPEIPTAYRLLPTYVVVRRIAIDTRGEPVRTHTLARGGLMADGENHRCP